MRIVIINGPNLNLLGKREPEFYGSQSFGDFFKELQEEYSSLDLVYYQSNHEGDLIDYLHQEGFSADGIVINAGAYTHTSIAIADAIKAISSPCIEVHISNVAAREDYRQQSYLAANCVGSITGLGLQSYRLAINYFSS